MTNYTVHLYREMGLVYRDIEADTLEAAARIAANKPTDEATLCEDCEGLTYAALVERDGDHDHGDDEESETVRLRADGGEIEPAPKNVMNAHRAKWAEAALSVFMQHTGCDQEDALGDLLCDLMHFGHQRNYDLAAALDRALGHFEAELVDAGEVPPGRPGARCGRFAHALAPLLEALENLLPHAAHEVEDRKTTRVAQYGDLEAAVEKARAAVSAATKPQGSEPPLLAALSNLLGEADYGDSGTCIGCGRDRGDGESKHCAGYWGEIEFDCPRAYARAAIDNAGTLPLPAESTSKGLLDTLLDIKLLAQKHEDSGYEPYAVLEEIERNALAALAKAKGGAQ